MFTSLQRIRFDDVDGAGIVYYPRFFHLCHAAFEDFFNAEGPCSYPDLIIRRRRGFPTVHIDSDFTRPLRYGDTARVEVGTSRLGSKSASFRYIIRREGETEAAFSAHVVTAYLDLDAQRALPLDADIRSFLEKHHVP